MNKKLFILERHPVRVIIIFTFFTCLTGSTSSQVIARQSLSCLGYQSKSMGMVFQQSIGQASCTHSFQAGSYVLRQGFIQPSPGAMVNEPKMKINYFEIVNPVVDELHIRFLEHQASGKLLIYNILGEQVEMYQVHETKQMDVPVTDYIPGVYLVSFVPGANMQQSRLMIIQ